MKLTTILLLIATLQVFARGVYSQYTDLTLNLGESSVGQVLTEIENQTEFYFLFNQKLVDTERKVNVRLSEKKIGEVLDHVFSGTTTDYVVMDRQIVLSPKEYLAEVKAALQPRTITGTIVGPDGEPLPGVSVIVKGSTQGTITDAEGNYSFSDVPDDADVLVFSFVGMRTQEVEVGSQTRIDMRMEKETIGIEEVVVVGYGTMRRSDITGSVSDVDSETLNSGAPETLQGALQGRVPGLIMTSDFGKPGQGYNSILRGHGSLNRSNEPLIVVDGIPGVSMNSINPSDVESINVLKDASAAAIYGSRGANGVILVTTKSGLTGEPQINFDSYIGIRTYNPPDMWDAHEWLEYRTVAFNNLGMDISRDNEDFVPAEVWENFDNENFHEWMDEVFHTGLKTSHTLDISGGNEKSYYSAGMGYSRTDGNSGKQFFERYTMRIKFQQEVTNFLTAGINMYGSITDREQGDLEDNRTSMRMNPAFPMYEEDGSIVVNPMRGYGYLLPSPHLSEKNEHETRNYEIYGNIYLEFVPIEQLSIKSTLSPRVRTERFGVFEQPVTKRATDWNDSRSSYNTNNYFSYVFENLIRYKESFREQHNIEALFGQSAEMYRNEGSNISTEVYSYDASFYNQAAANRISRYGSYFTKATLLSFFSRINYNFSNKYLLTVSGRYDGSSRLSEGNKWHFFPSAALAWRMTEENFFQMDAISDLKLRVGYGTLGNDQVNIYGTQANLGVSFYPFGDQQVSAWLPNNMPNSTLGWEVTSEVNVGIDFALIKGRIRGSIDLYNRLSKDLIMNRQLPSPSGWDNVIDNIGTVRNRGLELMLHTVNINKPNFSWRTDFTFGKNKNEIVELFGTGDDVTNKWFIGEPLSVYYDLVFDGIWQADEADEAAKYGDEVGQVKVKDLDGDGIITAANDKKIIGTPFADFDAGMTNIFTYKNLTLSFFIYTRQGEMTFSGEYGNFFSYELGSKRQRQFAVDKNWYSDENPSNEIPKPGDPGKNNFTRRYADVSFIRVKNITLSYTLPQNLINKSFIDGLVIYFKADQPFTFTDYLGCDPEWHGQYNGAFSSSNFVVGINLTL